MEIQKPIKSTNRSRKCKNSHASQLYLFDTQLTLQQYSKIQMPYFLGNNRIWKQNIYSKDHLIDPRLQYLKYQWIVNRNVADLGCGQGFLTTMIAKYLSPASIHGIDIDEQNIISAQSLKKSFTQRTYRTKKSKQDSQFLQQIKELPLCFQKKMSKNSKLAMLSCENILIPIPKLGKTGDLSQRQNDFFPLNLSFFNKNIFLMEECIKHYDTVLCMRLTKWIHLGFGDRGIQQLFSKLYYILKTGGILILQAQDFKSYKKASHMNKTHEFYYKSILKKPEMFKEMLCLLGMQFIMQVNSPQLKYSLQIFLKRQKNFNPL